MLPSSGLHVAAMCLHGASLLPFMLSLMNYPATCLAVYAGPSSSLVDHRSKLTTNNQAVEQIHSCNSGCVVADVVAASPAVALCTGPVCGQRSVAGARLSLLFERMRGIVGPAMPNNANRFKAVPSSAWQFQRFLKRCS